MFNYTHTRIYIYVYIYVYLYIYASPPQKKYLCLLVMLHYNSFVTIIVWGYHTKNHWQNMLGEKRAHRFYIMKKTAPKKTSNTFQSLETLLKVIQAAVDHWWRHSGCLKHLRTSRSKLLDTFLHHRGCNLKFFWGGNGTNRSALRSRSWNTWCTWETLSLVAPNSCAFGNYR
jgi:hypothetical protein